MNTKACHAVHKNEYAYKSLCFCNDLMQDVDIPFENDMFCNQYAHSWNKNVIPTCAVLEKKLEIIKIPLVL